MQFSLFGGFLLPYCDARLQSEYQADPAIVSVCSTRDQERRTETPYSERKIVSSDILDIYLIYIYVFS